MTPDDYDNAVTIGFLFGVRLMENLHDLEQSPGSLGKIQDHLKQIAAGDIAMGATPAELRLRMPELDAEKLEQHRSRSVQQNQKQAQAILRVQARRSGN